MHEILALRGLLYQSLGCAGQFIKLMVCQILYHELETAKLSQALNCGGECCKHNRAGNAKQPRTYAVHNGGRGVLFAFALRIGLERHENDSLVCRRSREAEARD